MTAIQREIEEAYEKITERDIARAKMSLTPPEEGETVICQVQSVDALRYWAVANEYDRATALLVHTARFEADDILQSRSLLMQARRLASLAEISRDMAWLAMKDEAGEPAYSAPVGIGLRENFTLVANNGKPNRDGEEAEVAIMKIGRKLGSALAKLASGDQEPEEEPEKKKGKIQ